MSDHLFAAFDLGLVFAVAFGLGVWQLVTVRRSIRRDRRGDGEAARGDGEGGPR